MTVASEAAARSRAPDPLDFVLEALAADGALVEREDSAAMVLLPPPLAARLALPEECRLVLFPERRGDVGYGLGTPLLEQLIARARVRVAAAFVRLTLEPPRPAHVRAVADRFVLRNGLVEVVQVSMGTAAYLAAGIAYVAEADDRREGLLRLVAGPDGSEPDEAVAALLDLTWPSATVNPLPAPLPLGDAPRWIAARCEAALGRAVRPIMDDVARRHTRDHERIAAYFEALIAEAQAPRRRTDPKAVEAKVAHLLAERDKKLHDLSARFALRVTAAPAALWGAELPAALVDLKLRRRKAARAITLRVPAGAHVADRLACEGCGAATGRPAACDERMHLLCEACAPNAQGRIACPACGAR